MTARRKLSRIIIRVDTVTGFVVDIEATVEMLVTESGLVMSGKKVYAKDYDSMGATAKMHVDVFVTDVNDFIRNQEPRI